MKISSGSETKLGAEFHENIEHLKAKLSAKFHENIELLEAKFSVKPS